MHVSPSWLGCSTTTRMHNKMYNVLASLSVKPQRRHRQGKIEPVDHRSYNDQYLVPVKVHKAVLGLVGGGGLQGYMNPIPATSHCPCPCTRSTQATHVISMGGHYSVAPSSTTRHSVELFVTRPHHFEFWTCSTGIAAAGQPSSSVVVAKSIPNQINTVPAPAAAWPRPRLGHTATMVVTPQNHSGKSHSAPSQIRRWGHCHTLFHALPNTVAWP